MYLYLLHLRGETFVLVWRLLPLPGGLPGGVLQLDGHAGVEEEAEEEVEDWVTRDVEVAADLRPDNADTASEHHVEYPAKHVGPVHCQLQELEENWEKQEGTQTEQLLI